MRFECSARSLTRLLLVAGLTLFFSAACKNNRERMTVTPVPETSPLVINPVDYGNGVFYFPVTGRDYVASLSAFYEGNGKHCDLQGTTERVVQVAAGYAATRHTETTGFILHCHDLAVEAQSVTVP